MIVGLPGWHVEKPATLDLFPSYVWEPKIEGRGSVYICIYLYICVQFELKFLTIQVASNRTVRFKPQHLATLNDSNETPSRTELEYVVNALCASVCVKWLLQVFTILIDLPIIGY